MLAVGWTFSNGSNAKVPDPLTLLHVLYNRLGCIGIVRATKRADRIRQAATKQARERLGRNTIGEVVAELYADFVPDEAGVG